MHLRFVAAAAADHPLHGMDRALTQQDLHRHRQLVTRDSDPARKHDAGWLGASARGTLSHKATPSIRAACIGPGYAWYAEDMIRDELASGALRPLPLREGAERYGELYLVPPDRDYAGPGTQSLATLFSDAARNESRRR